MRDDRASSRGEREGYILEFRHGEDAAARIAKPVDGSLGQIIIFPGVRIDRRASERREKQGAARRRAQRGRKK